MTRDNLILGVAFLSLVVTVYALVTLQSVRADRERDLQRFEKLEADIRNSVQAFSAARDDRAAGAFSPVSMRARVQKNLGVTGGAGPGAFAESDGLENDTPSPEVEDMVDTIVSRVQERLDTQVEKVERENKRSRNRSGEWRAKIDELAEELELDEDQTQATTDSWNALKDEAFEFARADLGDGSSLIDDLIAEINSGVSDREAWGNYFRRMGDKMPGSDRTFGQYFEEMRQNLEAELTQNLTEEQMRRLRELKISWWEVSTGYNPWRDYMEERISR